jgi:hypothetical protein
MRIRILSITWLVAVLLLVAACSDQGVPTNMPPATGVPTGAPAMSTEGAAVARAEVVPTLSTPTSSRPDVVAAQPTATVSEVPTAAAGKPSLLFFTAPG